MGRPVVHWEFWSEDPQKVSKFYQQVFDWKIRSIAELDYTLVETGGTGGINGGIMKVRGSRWQVARDVEAEQVGLGSPVEEQCRTAGSARRRASEPRGL